MWAAGATTSSRLQPGVDSRLGAKAANSSHHHLVINPSPDRKWGHNRSHWLGRRSRRTLRRLVAFFAICLALFTVWDWTRPEGARRILSGEDVWRNRMSQFKEGIGSAGRRGKRKNQDLIIRRDPRVWPGWAGIHEIYAFGDSHTDTNFNTNGPQPDFINPLGNPAWPGRTANVGPNYLGHLTATFNQSFIKTFNFAVSGSPFEASMHSGGPQSIMQQIEKRFIPRYGKSSKLRPDSKTGTGNWHQADSLFLIYHGVDDILFTFKNRGGGRNETTVALQINELGRAIDALYSAGARNFILINYPELEKSPFMRGSGIKNNIMDMGAEIVQYNGRLAFMAHTFAEAHPDANVFVYDNHRISLAIREEPLQFPETEQIQKLEGFCYPYADRDKRWHGSANEIFDELCGVALDGWYWQDDMHMTEPFHVLAARLIVRHLGAPGNRLPMEFY